MPEVLVVLAKSSAVHGRFIVSELHVHTGRLEVVFEADALVMPGVRVVKNGLVPSGMRKAQEVSIEAVDGGEGKTAAAHFVCDC